MNVHKYEVAPVELLVKLTVIGAQPVVGFAVKLAVGSKTMTTVCVSVMTPQTFVAVNVTVYVPLAAYVWVGLISVEVWPSPKFQR